MRRIKQVRAELEALVRRSLRSVAGLLLLMLVASVLTPATAGASTPGAGTLSLAGNHTVGWQSPVYAKGTFGGPESCPASDPDNATCDHFDLTVDVPASYWDD